MPYFNAGSFIVLEKIIGEYHLPELLQKYMSRKDAGLLLDLACYSIISEDNAGQYYPDYAYCHPLFTSGMRIYSDSKVSDFLHSIKADQTVGFLNSWNESRNKREKVYISYDSTNKNCQAGDIDIVEFGHPKTNAGLPVFNYSVAYDTANREPLFYEQYPGSINDVSQLRYAVDKAYSYGYRKLGFILDRGYFSRANLAYMDKNGYSFIIMVKGMKKFIRGIVLEQMGTFENRRAKYIDRYDVYGTTVPGELYEGDEQTRYIHVYYSDVKALSGKQQVKEKIRRMKAFLDSCEGKEKEFGPGFEEYFYLHYEKDRKTFAIAEEKLFRSDKTFIGNRSMRTGSGDAASARIFIEFIALIIRCRLYTMLKDRQESMSERPNYLMVPAALKELEKIVMIRQLDGIYRLDHAVTKHEKVILDAFGISEANVRYRTGKIGKSLEQIMGGEEKEAE